MAAPDHPDTRCVHAGAEDSDARYGLNTPVVTATAFDYRDDGTVRYPRYLNTVNHRVVARKLATLEGAGDALVTASGMGALSALFLTVMRPGDHAVLLEGLYGGTTDLVEGLLKPLGMAFTDWNGEPDDLPGLMRDNTRLMRLSVGIEGVEELWGDLERALSGSGMD